MKSCTKIFVFVCVFVLAFNICGAQSSTDSSKVKKTVLQKKSKVFTRVELGFPVGYVAENDAFNGGLLLSVTVGYSLSKNVRLGLGTEYLYFENEYMPVFISTEFGNHTKRVNASLNINAGYAFTFNDMNVDESYGAYTYNGLLVELLPTISFGSYQSKNRFRISLGNQILSTSNAIVFYDQSPQNNRFEGSSGNNRIVRMNLLVKFGFDF